MTFRVAVLCEDHTNDQYILRPLVRETLAHLGKPDARITVVSNPRIRGFDSLLARACDVIERYAKLVDLILVCYDLDGQDGSAGRTDKHARVKNALNNCPNSKTVTIGAEQEIEVWALWGSRAQLPHWAEVRAEAHAKERYFDPLITSRDSIRADGGRSRLMESSLAAGITSLVQGCPELGELLTRIRDLVGS